MFDPLLADAAETAAFVERGLRVLSLHAGFVGLLLILTLALAAYRTRDWRLWLPPLVLAALLAWHPVWTVRATLDCDRDNWERLEGSALFGPSLLAVIAFLWQVWFALTGREAVGGPAEPPGTETGP